MIIPNNLIVEIDIFRNTLLDNLFIGRSIVNVFNAVFGPESSNICLRNVLPKEFIQFDLRKVQYCFRTVPRTSESSFRGKMLKEKAVDRFKHRIHMFLVFVTAFRNYGKSIMSKT